MNARRAKGGRSVSAPGDRIHVLHVIDVLGDGGAEMLLAQLARVAGDHRLDVEVVALRPLDGSPAAAEVVAHGVRIDAIASTARRQLLDVRRAARLVAHVRRRRPDVVHLHLSHAVVLGALTARLLRLPAVATLHNTEPDQRRHGGLVARLERVALRSGVDRVVAVGPEVARAHQDRLRPQIVEVQGNPARPPSRLSAAARTRLRAELTDDPDRPLVLSVGRLTEQKAYPDLLQAWATVASACPEARLVVAGDGPDRDAVEALAADLGLDGSVQLLGTRRDVPDLLAAADIFATAAHWEGMPLATLEAMAAGLPVVATAVGDVPAALGGAGVLVEPGEPDALAAALCSLLDDPTARERLGAAARERSAAHHGVDAWAAGLRRTYEAVLAERGR